MLAALWHMKTNSSPKFDADLAISPGLAELESWFLAQRYRIMYRFWTMSTESEQNHHFSISLKEIFFLQCSEKKLQAKCNFLLNIMHIRTNTK